MLDFKPITLKDVPFLQKKLFSPARFSCETNIVNLLVWQKMYDNRYAVKDDILFIKSGGIEQETFRLPFGENLEKGMKVLQQYTAKQNPPLWVQQGERFTDFNYLYGDSYELIPERDAFDYIYLQQDLASLSGKKYHSKRNHIAAFSKKYNWRYEAITKENTDKVLECAQKWYSENSDRFDKYMQCEKDGIKLILENMELLQVSGGAIYVDEQMVAFTLGSPINRDVFDIHIEKALQEYSTAYTVINHEFAKRLKDYKYINREDDLGIEGIRKAKLSYKPYILLKKYSAISKKERCKQIYNSAFGEEDGTFEEELFEKCYKYCRFIEKEGRVVSLCFALPCKLGEINATYVFAVTTAQEFRGKGYAKELLEKVEKESELLVLRPAKDTLIDYYKQLGFTPFKATNKSGDFSLEPMDEFLDFAQKYKEFCGEYIAMYKGDKPKSLENLSFSYSML